MASDDWVHYKCKTGNTFFIHNKHTVEYRWLTEVNGPQLTPVKYSTIATQTDDYQCSNGCSSIYASTKLCVQSSHSDNFYQATPENTIYHHGNNKEDQGTCHTLSNSNLESHHFGKDELPNQSHTFDKLNPENPIYYYCKEKLPDQSSAFDKLNPESPIHYYGKDKLPDQNHAFDKSNPQSPVYHYNENKLDQSLVYNNKSHESDQESTLYSEYFTRRSSCFDEIPSMVKVFDRGMHSQSVTTETVTDNIHVDVTNDDDDECNGNDDGNGNDDCKTNVMKCYNGSVDNLSKANKISFATNINIKNEKLDVIDRVDSVKMPDHESLFPKDTEHELASSKLWQEEPQSMENIPVIENQSSHDKSHSTTVTVAATSQAQPQSTISHGKRKAKFQCSICKRQYLHRKNLNQHLRVHANENKLYDCSYCNKKFQHKGYLKLHLKIHTSEHKPYVCHRCDKRFTLERTLKDHIAWHAGARPFKCNHCKKTFTKKKHLMEHMKRHNGTAKVLPCSYCGKTFSVQRDLNMHIRIHTGIKPHACTFCDMKFTHRGNLNRHLQTHTGEKPYECSYCKKSFARSTYLKTHMKTHLEKNQETSED